MMSRLDHIEELVARRPAGRIVVAAAHDDHILTSMAQVLEKGYAEPILIGDKDKILNLADTLEVDVSGMIMIKELDERKCADMAVNMINNGEADIIMKGLMQTADLLKAVLERDRGLRTGALLSHVCVCEVDGYPKLLFVTDGGINIAPDLHQKAEIIRNAVAIARSLGVAEPKVAALAAIETVNPAMPSTLDAASLAMMSKRGQIKDCQVDGPLAMDNAISLDAARHKQISSDVAGDADILLAPDIEAGNILVKTLVFLQKARSCSVITGAKVPLVVTSRADSSETKYHSILLALAMLGQNLPERKGN